MRYIFSNAAVDKAVRGHGTPGASAFAVAPRAVALPVGDGVSQIPRPAASVFRLQPAYVDEENLRALRADAEHEKAAGCGHA